MNGLTTKWKKYSLSCINYSSNWLDLNLFFSLSLFWGFFFVKALSDQPVVDTATATEQAKMLIKSGAISAIKSENKNSGFKRSRMLEIKLKVGCPVA